MTRRLFLPLLSITLTMAFAGCRKATPAQDSAPEPQVQLTPVQFAADSAMMHVNRQCDLGPRVPGTSAHAACADYIAARMAAYGLSVENQPFDATTWDGKAWRGRNIIARYNAGAAERVVLAAHWDSRPWADADPDSSRHREPVMAANDGAAGVAVLLEVARCLKELKPQVGVDLVCFDLEDYGAPYWERPPTTAPTGAWARSTGVARHAARVIRHATASSLTWSAATMPASATKASACATPAPSWSACGRQPPASAPPTSSSAQRADTSPTTMCR